MHTCTWQVRMASNVRPLNIVGNYKYGKITTNIKALVTEVNTMATTEMRQVLFAHEQIHKCKVSTPNFKGAKNAFQFRSVELSQGIFSYCKKLQVHMNVNI